ncbi:hypothetical protein pb186bvf_008471 [Paramecium bursaria]
MYQYINYITLKKDSPKFIFLPQVKNLLESLKKVLKSGKIDIQKYKDIIRQLCHNSSENSNSYMLFLLAIIQSENQWYIYKQVIISILVYNIQLLNQCEYYLNFRGFVSQMEQKYCNCFTSIKIQNQSQTKEWVKYTLNQNQLTQYKIFIDKEFQIQFNVIMSPLSNIWMYLIYFSVQITNMQPILNI